jgi:hypothetical protein
VCLQIRTEIFDKIYDLLNTTIFTEKDTDRVQILYKQFIAFAATDAQKMKLNDLLQDKDLTKVSSVVEVSNEYCWEIVKKVFSVSPGVFPD